jgi:hypothetical protein
LKEVIRIMLYDKNASPWNRVEILGVGMNLPDKEGSDRIITHFTGKDEKERIILNLSSTLHFIPLEILEEGEIIPQAGKTIEVMFWGSEICAMRNLPVSPPKALPNPAAEKQMNEVPIIASR